MSTFNTVLLIAAAIGLVPFACVLLDIRRLNKEAKRLEELLAQEEES